MNREEVIEALERLRTEQYRKEKERGETQELLVLLFIVGTFIYWMITP